VSESSGQMIYMISATFKNSGKEAEVFFTIDVDEFKIIEIEYQDQDKSYPKWFSPVRIEKSKRRKKMADMKWEGHLSYESKDLGNQNYKSYLIPVEGFSVAGGALRRVELPSAEDMVLIHEIEQARRLRNLTLHLLVAQNFDWVYDLLEIAARDLPLSVVFFVNGKNGTTPTHSFRLICKNARITQPQEPSTTYGADTRLFTIRLAIPNTELVHGSHQNGAVTEEDW
jgi:hypothetical protein